MTTPTDCGGHRCGCAGGPPRPLIDTLSSDHVLHTMMAEHAVIMGYLEELDLLNHRIQGLHCLDDATADIAALGVLAATLIDAEPHHQREEKVLFPALESRGVYGPPQVMCMEHEVMRDHKHRLKTLASGPLPPLAAFKAAVNTSARFLVQTLSSHIHKENTILYPMALQVIDGDTDWQTLKSACDEIGYCRFTPKK